MDKKEKIYVNALAIAFGLITAVAILHEFHASTYNLPDSEKQVVAYVFIAAYAVWLFYLVVFLVRLFLEKRRKRQSEHDNIMITEIIETFTGLVDAKDTYTAGHSSRVGEYTSVIAAQMGYSEELCREFKYAGILHDSGKIGIADEILTKPGRLTEEEFGSIKQHTIKGGEILQKLKSIPSAQAAARYHHERYDGKGYPDGIRGEDIPLVARIVCVADSFDAMNSSRCYRTYRDREYIIDEIKKNSGRQFDPDVVAAFIRAVEKNEIRFEGSDIPR